VPDYVQELDIRGAIATTGAGYERVLGAAYTTSTVARARTERRPVVVDIPYHMLELEPPDTDAPARKPGQSFPVTRPDPAAVEEALGALLGARRPVLIAGRGAVSSGAHDVLVELADLLSMPVATSMLAKDFFRGHPLNLGTCGSVAMSTAIDRIAGADCVIAFGASLNQYTADRGRLLNQDKRIIQVDTAPQNVGQYLDADITVAGDAAQVATALVELVHESGVELPKRSEERLRATLASASPQDEFKDVSTEDLLDVRTALVTLDRLLPEARRRGNRFCPARAVEDRLTWRWGCPGKGRHPAEVLSWGEAH
jgi:acetolactate synthase I/II/III large subunit